MTEKNAPEASSEDVVEVDSSVLERSLETRDDIPDTVILDAKEIQQSIVTTVRECTHDSHIESLDACKINNRKIRIALWGLIHKARIATIFHAGGFDDKDHEPVTTDEATSRMINIYTQLIKALHKNQESGDLSLPDLKDMLKEMCTDSLADDVCSILISEIAIDVARGILMCDKSEEGKIRLETEKSRLEMYIREYLLDSDTTPPSSVAPPQS